MKTPLLAVLLAATAAQAVSPKLSGISPVGAQRGDTVEFRFTGLRLDDVPQIVFFDTGFEVLKQETKADSIKATVKISDTARVGEHLVRIRTSGGVSDVRTVFISPYPNLEEKEPNSELTKAQLIAPNTTINGGTGGEDVDFFRVEGRAGQRLAAEVEAIRLGRAMLDTYISIRDASGKILASSDDTALLQQDSCVSIVPPKDGAYYVEVRDTSYGGSDGMKYRLHIGNFPRPTAVYPAGGKPGETVKARFLGDAGGEVTQEVKVPAKSGEKFGAFAEAGGKVAPSPNWMRAFDGDNTLESEPNNSREQASTAFGSAPLALNGVLEKDGDEDWFKFTAKKGDSLDVNVYARRLRTPVDSILEIKDAKGASLASNDDGAGQDSTLKFSPPTDGEYFIRVRDQLGKGGADCVYRVEIAPSRPSISFSFPQIARNNSQDRQWIAVPRGNRFVALANIKRNGFSSDVAFSLEGGPKDIKILNEPLSSKVDAVPMVFEVPAEAPIGGKLCELIARPLDSKYADVRGTWRNTYEFIDAPGQSHYYRINTDKIYAAVVAEAPFRIRIEEPKVPLVQFGSMDLRVIAERKAGFDDPISVKMVWNPPGIGSLPDVTIPKGASVASYNVNASGTAQAGKWRIAMSASAKPGGGGEVFVSSQLAALEVAEPFVVGKIAPLNTEAGKTVKLVCALEQRQPFEGKATVKLMGLPEGATAADRQITSADKEVSFDVVLSPKVANGSYKQLFCAADIRKGGQTIPHSLGSGGTLRIVPPKKGATDAAAAKAVTATKK